MNHGQTHGHSVGGMSPTYRSWVSMLRRCNAKPGSYHWPYYAGRGITVCDRWRSFEMFLADMGERPDGTTLDRRDNGKGYEPGNCRWATRSEQAANKRNTRTIAAHGETVSTAQMAAAVGVSQRTIQRRLARGWSDEQVAATGRLRALGALP